MKIAIIDYGAGNCTNVKNAIEKIDASMAVSISASERDWKNADALVLPGVGAFGAAMRKLGEKKQNIVDEIGNGKPFLGICLGMQLLFDKSGESKNTRGFGIIKGKVKKFSRALPVPQMGWNLLEGLRSELFDDLFDGPGGFYAYFVHSYYCEPEDRDAVAATTEYGIKFASAVARKNLFATQFHPEKSGEYGLRVLKNFI